MLHRFSLPLIIVGVLLSTLHQSSLGSLYLIVPEKLYALWYSPYLPVFFYVSAIAVGCAMVIFESFMSSRAFAKGLEMDLLDDIARFGVVMLAIFLLAIWFTTSRHRRTPPLAGTPVPIATPAKDPAQTTINQ